MNILYTITWPASDSGDLPRQFFEQLRAGVAQGARFPFDCPYEVALVRAAQSPDATPPAHGWAVAVLAMRVTTTEIGASEHTVPEMEKWFQQCIPGGIPAGSTIQSTEARHLKLASELEADFDVVENFGTFVGEPDAEAPAPAAAPPPPVSPKEAPKAGFGQPLTQEAQKILTSPPVSTPPDGFSPPLAAAPPARPAQSDDSDKLGTCLGIGLMAGGVLLIPVSLLLGALLALGQFSTDPTTGGATNTSTTDFVLLLACCPVPLLVLAVGMILLGVYLPRWMKQNQPRPAAPPTR